MGAPLGSKNAEGNSGGNSNSGRKSAYQEHADAEALYKMFFAEMSKEEVQKKLKTGTYSLKDALMAKGFGGSERVLTALFNRVFPTNINLGGQEGNPLVILSDEQLDDRIRELKRILGATANGEGEEKR